jgi:hypothetical protein
VAVPIVVDPGVIADEAPLFASPQAVPLQNVRNVEVVLNATAPVFAALQVGSATVVYRGTPKNVEAVRAFRNSC